MDQLINNLNRLQKEKISVENKIRDNRNTLNEYEQISKKSKRLLESILEVFHNSSDTSTFQEIYHSQIQEDNKMKKEFENEYISLRKKNILLERIRFFIFIFMDTMLFNFQAFVDEMREKPDKKEIVEKYEKRYGPIQ